MKLIKFVVADGNTYVNITGFGSNADIGRYFLTSYSRPSNYSMQ